MKVRNIRMSKCFECHGERPRNTLFCSDECRDNHFREYSRNKAKRYWENHKQIVDWGNDYIAPKFAGTVVEITYNHGYNYDLKKNSDIIIPADEVDSFVIKLSKILWCYFIESEIFSPMTIKVDEEGKCHLLMFNSNTGMHTTNKILRHGEVKIVDKNYKKKW